MYDIGLEYDKISMKKEPIDLYWNNLAPTTRSAAVTHIFFQKCKKILFERKLYFKNMNVYIETCVN